MRMERKARAALNRPARTAALYRYTICRISFISPTRRLYASDDGSAYPARSTSRTVAAAPARRASRRPS